MPTVTRLLPDISFGLGESPVWDERTQKLFWIDIQAPALHRLDPQTGTHDQWDWPEVISCCGLADNGAMIVSGRSGLWVFDPDTGIRDLAYPIPPLADDMRTNDGKVGPDGAFWISTMQDRADRGPAGVVMRIDGTGDVRTMLEGFTTANGMEWSPDGRTFYMSDTRALWVDRWDYDPQTVTLSDRRRFVTFEPGEGKPDGAAIDTTGAYWCAGIYAGRLTRFSPQGARLATHQLPTKMTTMPCFGGADMKTLFVTSLAPGKNADSADGGLYSIAGDIAGPAPRRFALNR